MAPDELQRHFYSLHFDLAFSEKNGNEFQEFFSKIMKCAYPGDFKRVRTYGNKGDKKCDGYRSSTKTVYQVYAPREMKEANLLKKAEEDFLGALAHWKKQMLEWIFVHNDKEGITADTVMLLGRLKTENEVPTFEWASDELKPITMGLSLNDLISLFGAVPAIGDLRSIDFEELRIALESIEQSPAPTKFFEIKPPSLNKISKNELSGQVVGLLAAGRQMESTVQDFFEAHPNPILGETIATRFHDKYIELRAIGMTSDAIFTELQRMSGGMDASIKRQASVLAILSYLFE